MAVTESVLLFGIVSILTGNLCPVEGNLTTSVHELEILSGTCTQFDLILSQPITRNVTVVLQINNQDIIHISNDIVTFAASNISQRNNIKICGFNPGHAVVNNTVQPNIIRRNDAFIDAAVYRYAYLNLISWTCGWVYFLTWSVSFYPQMYINYKRKSVVGLNFDFLALNVIGYLLYSIFNCTLYWVPFVKDQYFARHPRGLNPVQLNDVGFSVHALFVSILTISQCFIYERGEQTISKIARVIILIYAAILIAVAIFVYVDYIEILDFFYVCSYIKLCITLIKYIPQALMNYRRQSTVGWSIGNVICDFIGGLLSILQMIIISYNYDDWISIFGDFTKFGLGLISIMFDILFLLQHFVFYRHAGTSESEVKKVSS